MTRCALICFPCALRVKSWKACKVLTPCTIFLECSGHSVGMVNWPLFRHSLKLSHSFHKAQMCRYVMLEFTWLLQATLECDAQSQRCTVGFWKNLRYFKEVFFLCKIGKIAEIGRYFLLLNFNAWGLPKSPFHLQSETFKIMTLLGFRKFWESYQKKAHKILINLEISVRPFTSKTGPVFKNNCIVTFLASSICESVSRWEVK